MQFHTNLGDVRSNCQGLFRPRAGAHQSCGLGMAPSDYRVGLVAKPPASKPRPMQRNALPGFSVPSEETLGDDVSVNRLQEQDLFMFEPCGLEEDATDVKEGSADFLNVDDDVLIGARFDEQLPRSHATLGGFGLSSVQADLKRSDPVGIPPARRGVVSSLSQGLASDEWKRRASVKSSLPVPIPRPNMLQPVETHQKDPLDEEAFVPPHIFLARMNKDPLQISHTCRPRGLSSLRMRTAVLTETGYFDGYTEIGQRPKKTPILNRYGGVYSA
ncbi:hypothetical protein BSKO_01407 [Bryopsis sp. KO-2023]|nr:hypothetical protein BSKO_01407 [Bryopsis sp. KO-2023]